MRGCFTHHHGAMQHKPKSYVSSHCIMKCSNCGTVISQCRCKDKNKPTYYELCKECERLHRQEQANLLRALQRV